MAQLHARGLELVVDLLDAADHLEKLLRIFGLFCARRPACSVSCSSAISPKKDMRPPECKKPAPSRDGPFGQCAPVRGEQVRWNLRKFRGSNKKSPVPDISGLCRIIW